MSEARHVHHARRTLERAGQHQIGPLKSRGVEGKGSAERELHTSSQMLPGADQGRKHANRTSRRTTVLRALDTVVQANDSGRIGRVFARQELNVGRRNACQPGYMLRRVGLNMFAKSFESVGVPGDVVAVVEPFFDDEAHHAKRQSRIGAGLNGNVPVSGAGGAGSIGINHDESGAITACFFDEGPEVNVITVNVCRPGDDVLCMAEMFRVGAQLFSVDRNKGVSAGGGADGAIKAGRRRGDERSGDPWIRSPAPPYFLRRNKGG